MKKSLRFFCSLLIILLIFALTDCQGQKCNNIVVKESLSPQSNMLAVAFIRDCEGGVFSINVSLQKPSDSLNDSVGNVFCGSNSSTVDIVWENENSLIVRHTLLSNQFILREREYQGVEIRYENINEILENTE